MSSENPKVSVILPSHNPKKEWIEKAIESILNQTFQNFEIILIDDGSEPRIEDVIDKKYISNPKISYFKENNGSFTKSTNSAIEKTRGKYIAPIGDDDIWKKEKLERQINEIKNCGACFTNAIKIDENGNEIGYKGSFPQENRLDNLFYSCYPCYESAIYDKRVFEKFGILDTNFEIASDWEFWLRIWEKIDVTYIETALTKKRYHSTNYSNNKSEKLVQEDIEIINKYLKYYEKPTKFKNDVMSKYWRRTGKQFLTDNPKKAREMFKKSAKIKQNLLAYGLYISSYNQKIFWLMNDIYGKIK